ncbi:MAG: HEAT repeat domain-containing protein [Nitrosopumilaceae archaeon]|nr:HEAT repeat domain-containing protein [Nitrosopumilaceae archaeon]
MNDVARILETGDSAQKISVLEGLAATDRPDIIEKMIARLDDDDIRVRGEAFSSLILNENRIYEHLIKGLGSASKNVRGFASLILANRNETDSIPELVKLAHDKWSMVRSCAVGALGHMRAGGPDVRSVLAESLLDDSSEVRKSAAHAVITAGIDIAPDVIERVSDLWAGDVEGDPDLGVLLGRLKERGA